MVFAYTPAIIGNLESSHSPERLVPYYALAGNDKELGFQLYAWNSALSQAMYTPPAGARGDAAQRSERPAASRLWPHLV